MKATGPLKNVIIKEIEEHIKKTGGEPYNDGGILGRIFDGFGRY